MALQDNDGADLVTLLKQAQLTPQETTKVLAQHHGVPEDLAMRLIKNESAWQPDAVSPKGASGLSQLMPDTAKSEGVNNIFDPVENLNGGLSYLSKQYKRFGSWGKAIEAYNMGPEGLARGNLVPGSTQAFRDRVLGGGQQNQQGQAQQQATPSEPPTWIDFGGKQFRGTDRTLAALMSADQDMKAAGLSGVDARQVFRDLPGQIAAYDRYKSGRGGIAAEPGKSRHGYGEAIDVNNWQEAAPYLAKYGLTNPIKGDEGHFQFADTPTGTNYAAPGTGGASFASFSTSRRRRQRTPEEEQAWQQSLDEMAGIPKPGTQQAQQQQATPGIDFTKIGIQKQAPQQQPAAVFNPDDYTTEELAQMAGIDPKQLKRVKEPGMFSKAATAVKNALTPVPEAQRQPLSNEVSPMAAEADWGPNATFKGPASEKQIQQDTKSLLGQSNIPMYEIAKPWRETISHYLAQNGFDASEFNIQSLYHQVQGAPKVFKEPPLITQGLTPGMPSSDLGQIAKEAERISTFKEKRGPLGETQIGMPKQGFTPEQIAGEALQAPLVAPEDLALFAATGGASGVGQGAKEIVRRAILGAAGAAGMQGGSELGRQAGEALGGPWGGLIGEGLGAGLTGAGVPLAMLALSSIDGEALRSVYQKLEQSYLRTTKQTSEGGRTFNLSPDEVRAIWNTVGGSYSDEGEALRALGLSREELKRAVKEGISIQTPESGMVQSVDRPWVAAIKRVFGRTPYEGQPSFTEGGPEYAFPGEQFRKPDLTRRPSGMPFEGGTAPSESQGGPFSNYSPEFAKQAQQVNVPPAIDQPKGFVLYDKPVMDAFSPELAAQLQAQKVLLPAGQGFILRGDVADVLASYSPEFAEALKRNRIDTPQLPEGQGFTMRSPGEVYAPYSPELAQQVQQQAQNPALPEPERGFILRPETRLRKAPETYPRGQDFTAGQEYPVEVLQQNRPEPAYPERRETLQLQVDALAAGDIPVVMFPPDTPKASIPGVPKGMKRYVVSGDVPGAGVYYYNPKDVKRIEIQQAAEQGQHHTLLGIVQPKLEAMANGQPMAIQAVDPKSGVPLQDVVVDGSNPQIVDQQVRSLQGRWPNAVIQARQPGDVISERMAGQKATKQPETRRQAQQRVENREQELLGGKEPYQVTRNQYIAMSDAYSEEAGLTPEAKSRRKDVARKNHAIYVEQALKEGKPVSPAVLADYPGFQAKATKATPLPPSRVATSEPTSSGKVESDQERSYREWEANFQRVMDDPTRASEKDLIRAQAYLQDHVLGRINDRIMRGEKGLEEVAAGLESELEGLRYQQRLRSEKAAPEMIATTPAPVMRPQKEVDMETVNGLRAELEARKAQQGTQGAPQQVQQAQQQPLAPPSPIRPEPGTAAANITDNTLVNSETMGEVEQRILAGNKGIREELGKIRDARVQAEGEAGINTFKDWMNPAKVGSRIYQELRKQGMDHKTARERLGDLMDDYEWKYKEVLEGGGEKVVEQKVEQPKEASQSKPKSKAPSYIELPESTKAKQQPSPQSSSPSREEVVSMLKSAESDLIGGQGPVLKQVGSEYSRLGSGNPDWFVGNGWTKRETYKAIDKAINGDKLTPKQQDIINSIIESKTKEYEVMYGYGRDKETGAGRSDAAGGSQHNAPRKGREEVLRERQLDALRSAAESINESLGRTAQQGGRFDLAKASTEEHLLVRAVHTAQGRTTVFWETSDPVLNGINGFTDPEIPDHIFLNANAGAPLFNVGFHETMHLMEGHYPDVYDLILDLKDDAVGYDAYVKNLERIYGDYGGTLNGVDTYSEFVSDFLGDQMRSKEFMDLMKREHPEVFAGLELEVSRLFHGRKGQLWKGQYFSDMEAARKNLAQALAEYTQRSKAFKAGEKQRGDFNLSLSELPARERKAMDKELKKLPDGNEVLSRIEKLDGTPWAKQAIDSLVTREGIDSALDGKAPEATSSLNAPSMKNTMETILDKGEAGIWKMLRRSNMLSHPSKPVNSIPGSYPNCDPSPDCAKFCYAASGRNHPSTIVAAELTNWAIANDPVRAAKMIASQYKIMPEFEAQKALRILDRGEAGQGWEELVAELNDHGIRVQAFSKRPDFLRGISQQNVRMLSTDSSNIDKAEENPDLKVALVYSGQRDLPLVDQFKGRIQVILPVKVGKKILPREDIKALPMWSRKYACPIDSGLKTIEGGWNCTKCDAESGLPGCFYQNSTAKVMNTLKPITERDINKYIQEAQSLIERMDDAHRQRFSQELALLLSEVRGGIDPGAEEASGGSTPQASGRDQQGRQGRRKLSLSDRRGSGESQQPAVDKHAPFYSQMQQVIGQKLPESGLPAQYVSTIKGWADKGEFKREELEWSGLIDWLKAKRGEGRVSKADVLKYLEDNKVEIKEVVKGEGQTEEKSGWYIAVRDAEDLGGTTIGSSFPTENEARQALRELFPGREDLTVTQRTRTRDVGTKFSQYTLPGGENYREVLLTLPTPTKKAYDLELFDPSGKVRWQRKGVSLEEAQRMKERYEKESQEGWHVEMSPSRVPDESRNYTSQHWDEPNVLVHVRMNDRTDVDGKKVLFIEEIQSDWMQEGRKKGYQGDFSGFEKEILTEAKKNGSDIGKVREAIDHLKQEPLDTDTRPTGWAWETLADATEGSGIDLNRFHDIKDSGVPNAPFKTTWPLLAFKRMIRFASENGYDRIAWTTGEQQAERYDLSKQIRRVEYIPSSETLRAFDLDGNPVLDSQVPPNKIEDYVGKEVAQKLLDSTPSKAGSGKEVLSVEGDGLKIGGTGMKGFYDKILPSEVNKYVKKWGAKVGETKLGGMFEAAQDTNSGEWFVVDMSKKDRMVESGEADVAGPFSTKEEASRVAKKYGTSVHSIDVTDAMRKSAMKGQPLFSLSDRAKTQGRVSKAEPEGWMDAKTGMGGKTGGVLRSQAGAIRLGGKDTRSQYQKDHVAHKDAGEFASSALRSALSKEGITRFLDAAYTKIVHAQYPVSKLVKHIAGPEAQKAIEDKIRRVRARSSIAETKLMDGPFGADMQRTGESLRSILKDIGTKERMIDYDTMRVAQRAVALHDSSVQQIAQLSAQRDTMKAEIKKMKKEPGWGDQKSQKYVQAYKDTLKEIERLKTLLDGIPDRKASIDELARLEAKYGPDGWKKFQDISEKHRKFEDQTILKPLLDIGKISQERYDQIKQSNTTDYYVSFMREMDSVENVVVAGGKTPSAIKQLRGSKKRILPGIEGTIANVANVTKLIETQALNKEFLKLRATPEGKAIIETVTAAPGMLPRDTITVFEDGKTYHYKVPHDIAVALDFYSPSEMNFVVKLLAMPATALRYGATMALDFVVRNPLRDQFTAAVYSKHGYIPFAHLAKGMFHFFKQDDLYKEFQAAGGEQQFFSMMDREGTILKASDLAGIKKHGAVRIVRALNPFKAIAKLSQSLEMGTRIGEYELARKKGETPEQAMGAARDLTLDFQRKGGDQVVRAMNAITAFWNAGVQGTDKMFRQFSDPETRKGTWIRSLLGITVPSMILWGLFHDDDRWKELPWWRKNFFWNIPIGSDGPILSIPKPFELGIIFGSLPERIMDYMNDNDPKAFKSISEAIKDGMFPSFIPTAILPIIESMTNYNFFMGQSIENQADQNLPPGMRASQYTSEIAKRAGEALDVSPKKIENWIRDWTGNLGKMGLDITDKMLADEEIQPVTKYWNEIIPGVKGFFAKEPIGSAGRSLDKFYDNLEDSTQKEMGYKVLKKTNPADAEKYKEKYGKDLNMADEARKVSKDLSELRKKKAEVMQSRFLDSDQKREQVDAIDRKMSEKAKVFNERYFARESIAMKPFESDSSGSDAKKEILRESQSGADKRQVFRDLQQSVKEGTITSKEAHQVWKDAQLSELQLQIKRSPAKTAVNDYVRMSEKERDEVAVQLYMKLRRYSTYNEEGFKKMAPTLKEQGIFQDLARRIRKDRRIQLDKEAATESGASGNE